MMRYSYTEADNSVVVVTDSSAIPPTVLAKISPHVLIPKRFALHLGTHLVSKYAHIHKAFVTVEPLRWSRISILGEQGPKDHPHAFIRDGDDKRPVSVEVGTSKGKDNITASVTAGISDLLVLKTTESPFSNFVRDKYTTLKEVDDRILSTSVDLSYKFAPIKIKSPTGGVHYPMSVQLVHFITHSQTEIVPGIVCDTTVPSKARKVTLETFATNNSVSVQATLCLMAQRLIAENAHVQSASYALPKKHYTAVDISYLGVENIVPAFLSPYTPCADGLITATATRK
ncbi:hypothetical protein C8J57DRAFT_1437580 [Mycena rebaudengoi]|nr:hypothetical protein C8J57DRAFT_1437580 [Mycena rebaudengoi]